MKKLFFSLIKLASTLSAIAQAPEKIKYQAVVRDANNELVSSQTIGMRNKHFARLHNRKPGIC